MYDNSKPASVQFTESLKKEKTSILSRSLILPQSLVRNIKEQEYVDPAGVLEYVLKYILNCNRESKNFYSNGPFSKYYAPLFAICQRSGSGKTKTIVEIGQKHLPVIYVGCAGNVKSPALILDYLKTCHLSKSVDPFIYESPGPWAHKILKFYFACADYAVSFFQAKLKPKAINVPTRDNLAEFVHGFFTVFSADMPPTEILGSELSKSLMSNTLQILKELLTRMGS